MRRCAPLAPHRVQADEQERVRTAHARAVGAESSDGAVVGEQAGERHLSTYSTDVQSTVGQW